MKNFWQKNWKRIPNVRMPGENSYTMVEKLESDWIKKTCIFLLIWFLWNVMCLLMLTSSLIHTFIILLDTIKWHWRHSSIIETFFKLGASNGTENRSWRIHLQKIECRRKKKKIDWCLFAVFMNSSNQTRNFWNSVYKFITSCSFLACPITISRIFILFFSHRRIDVVLEWGSE